MEHTETEQDGLKLKRLVSESLFEVALIELVESSSQVSLQVRRSFVSDLDGVLKDRLRYDFHFRHRWGLRRNEYSEVVMYSFFVANFKLSFEGLHP